MTKNTCRKLNKGWWNRLWNGEFTYTHEFKYSYDKKVRRCIKCGIREIYFGLLPGEGIREDWRPLIND